MLLQHTPVWAYRTLMLDWDSSKNLLYQSAVLTLAEGLGQLPFGFAQSAAKKPSPKKACALVEVQPDELAQTFQLQQHATFDAVLLDPWFCFCPGV